MGLLDGLFGSSKSEATVPDWVRGPIERNVNRAERVAGLGYTPYYGPDASAFTPMQNAAFDGTNMAASAFGMPSATGNGMPAPQTFAGGIQGYSSAPLYREALKKLKDKNPRQFEALMQIMRGGQRQAMGGQQGQQGPVPLGKMSGSDLMAMSPQQLSQLLNNSHGTGSGVTPHGASGYSSINTPLSYAPGGVNTRNPASAINQAIGSATNGFGYSASRPAPNPWR